MSPIEASRSIVQAWWRGHAWRRHWLEMVLEQMNNGGYITCYGDA